MIDRRVTAPAAGAEHVSLMDELVRSGLPEIKLALGEVIDRENARPLPPKYARLLPETHLAVILRADAAEALRPISGDIERELTDSCNRHGALYDRGYKVELQRTDDPRAPLYAVAITAGKGDAEQGAESGSAAPPVAAAASAAPSAGPPAALPAADPDATRLDLSPPTGWDPHRWMLIIEGDAEAREAFRILDPQVTVGRTASDPTLRPSIAISDAPHISRRQLVLRWQERDGAAGFRLYNIGLNPVLLSGRAITGAKLRGDELQLDSISAEHTGWLPPGVPIRIGEEGPTLRIEEVPRGPDEDVPVDPDATVFG